MPTYTAQELSRILSQPGYAISDGSSLPAPLQKSGVGGAIQANTVKHIAATEKRPSAVLWASEREFQAAVIAECNMRAVLEPEFGMIFHVANENSHRQPGVRGGVPDLCLPVLRVGPTAIYGACYVELKVGKNTLSDNQKMWIDRLRKEGNFVEVIWDSVAAVMSIFEEYLAL